MGVPSTACHHKIFCANGPLRLAIKHFKWLNIAVANPLWAQISSGRSTLSSFLNVKHQVSQFSQLHRACGFSYFFNISTHAHTHTLYTHFNPLNPELNPICCLLALLGDNHFLHVSRIKVKSLTLRLLMSHIYIYIWSTHS